MRKRVSFAWVIVLLALSAMSVWAQASVTVTPSSAKRGDGFTITASGLQANLAYRVEILFSPTSEVVYSTTRNADSTGTIVLPLRSEASDAIGEYRAQIKQNNAMVAEAVFTLLSETDTVTATPVVPLVTATSAPSQPTAQATTIAPTTQPTVAPTVAVRVVTLRVSPTSAPPRSTFTVTASGLRAEEVVFLVVKDGDSTEVYNRQWTATQNGTLNVELFTTADNAPGTYTVTLEDSTRAAIQSTTFSIESIDLEAVLAVDPSTATLGETVQITLTEARAFRDITISIEDEAGQAVFTNVIRTNVDGAGLSFFEIEGISNGEYSVIARDGNAEIARTMLTVSGDRVPLLIITPTEAIRGTTHEIRLEGLAPQSDIAFDIVFADSVIYSTTKTSDSEGVIVWYVATDDTDDTGTYTLRAKTAEEVLVAEATFDVIDTVATDPTPTPAPTQNANTTALIDTISGELTADEPEFFYEFTGKEGELISLYFASDAFDPYLVLNDDAGNELTSADDDAESLNSRVALFVLPYSGTYTVVGTSYDYANGYTDSLEGAFTLTLERVVVQEATYDTPFTVTLTNEAQQQYFAFDGVAGDVIRISADSADSVDSALVLYDPTGTEVAFDDDGGIGFDPEIARFVVLENGRYVLMSRLVGGAVGGEVSVLIERRALNSLDDGARTITLNAKQSSDALTFEAEAGQVLTMTLSVKSGTPSQISVSATQEGETLMSYETAYGIAPVTTLSFVVPYDGTLNVQVSHFGAGISLEIDLR